MNNLSKYTIINQLGTILIIKDNGVGSKFSDYLKMAKGNVDAEKFLNQVKDKFLHGPVLSSPENPHSKLTAMHSGGRYANRQDKLLREIIKLKGVESPTDNGRDRSSGTGTTPRGKKTQYYSGSGSGGYRRPGNATSSENISSSAMLKEILLREGIGFPKGSNLHKDYLRRNK